MAYAEDPVAAAENLLNEEEDVESKALIAKLDSMMDKEGVPELCSMIIHTLHAYSVLRAEIQLLSEEDDNNAIMALITGLTDTASAPFDLNDLIAGIRDELVPALEGILKARTEALKKKKEGEDESQG